MARSLFYVTGFITKERRNSSTERTGPGFTAFKASADRPAKKNATSDVISNQPIKTGHVFSPTRDEADHVFTDQARSCSRNSPTRKVGSAFFRTHVYCVSSPCSADPAWLSVVGFCGQSQYCKVVGYVSHKNATTDVISNRPIALSFRTASWSRDTPTGNCFQK